MFSTCDRPELWIGGIDGLKTKYLTALTNINRAGIADLAKYLQETDFFTAPASAKNHNNYPGGLCEHSLLVMLNAYKLSEFYPPGLLYESVGLVALLHDICKVNFYHQTTRNKKIDGVWTQEPYFEIQDSYPLGHGEKSVIILQRFITMTNEEIMAIRWHMMGFDDAAREYGGSMALRAAADKYPLVTILHMADLASCYLEGDGKK
jgi:hypothetical protein